MSIEIIALADLDPNPHRMLKDYPFPEAKIETLTRSIKDVGVWERVIVRRNGNRFQMAFGHKLVEAARRSGLTHIPVIVRELNDEEMLMLMSRENLEDWNSDFLVMLETWQAAVAFLHARKNMNEAIDIARFLGWTYLQGTSEQLNHTARSCFAAHALITAHHMSRDDLKGMSVRSAAEIVERTQSRIEMLEKMGAKGKRPRTEIDADKKHVAGAARTVAKDVREGNVRQRDIRSEIDYRAVKTAHDEKRESPLFAAFAKQVAEGIHKMLVDDKTAEKLAEMEKALPLVSMEEDRRALRRIDFALAEHEQTTGQWRKRLTQPGEKVVPFKMLRKEESA